MNIREKIDKMVRVVNYKDFNFVDGSGVWFSFGILFYYNVNLSIFLINLIIERKGLVLLLVRF